MRTEGGRRRRGPPIAVLLGVVALVPTVAPGPALATASGSVSGTVSGTVSGPAPGPAPGPVSGTVSGPAPGPVSGTVPGTASGTVSGTVSGTPSGTARMVSAAGAAGAAGADTVPVRLALAGVERIELARRGTGELFFRVIPERGDALALTPEAFAAFVHERAGARPLWQRFLNVSGPLGIAWVGLGLLGQLAFTGRMLVQWLASERRGRSYVPVGFWWLSIAGASMLLVYFVWRKDVIGVLGQSAGFLIYARNLWWIHRGRTPVVGG